MTESEFRACQNRTDLPARGPYPDPVGEQAPAPRALLEEPVSVEVSGTVLDALGALMQKPKWDWLASIGGGSTDKIAQFAAKDVPLWQALDRLLEAYGYDWGFRAGAVVCWPALTPARPRPDTPEATVDAEPPPTGDKLEIAEPTPVESVLAHFHPTQGRMEAYPTVDARLREWRLVGRVTRGDAVRAAQQIAAALTAVMQGDPREGVITVGAHMWLSQALRGADARATALRAQGVRLQNPWLLLVLRDRLRGLISGQQWSLMDLRGEAVMWFRELPLEVAEIWVLAAKASEEIWTTAKAEQPERRVDWSRPGDFYAVAFYSPDVQQSPTDRLYRIVGRRVGVSMVVMMTNGKARAM